MIPYQVTFNLPQRISDLRLKTIERIHKSTKKISLRLAFFI